MSDRREYEVRNDANKSSNKNKEAEDAIKKFMDKKGYLSTLDILEIYKKYGDSEAIEAFINKSTKMYRKTIEKAKILAGKIYKKYINNGMPLHEVLSKMMKYKIDNKWSDLQYDEFRKQLSNLLDGGRRVQIDNNQKIMANRSKVSIALGNVRYSSDEVGIRMKESDGPILAEILKMFESSTVMHRTVFMHSLRYSDCAIQAMTGQFNRSRDIASDHIHPLLACMFLPKFLSFDMHMLYANFGSIVKTRYEKKPIITKPDALLFDSITSDPNDVVCDMNSPLSDLKNRFAVQINLWETVLNLRNGKYYGVKSMQNLLNSLNSCRNNLYDNADLVYNQDEGSLLRRLLSVFSFRPTFIYTKPLFSISSYGAHPYAGINMAMAGGNFSFNSVPVHTVTSIPMITFQIPQNTANAESKNLESAINQTIWLSDQKSGAIIPKEQSIIHSNEVLIFYVNRRTHRVDVRSYVNPLSFSQLPLTMSMNNFDKLNAYPVGVPAVITLNNGEESYELRSIVAVTNTSIQQGNTGTKLITGCTGLITKPRKIGIDTFNSESEYYLYDPFGASQPIKRGNDYYLNGPITRLDAFFTAHTDDDLENTESFYKRAEDSGTIYIYAKDSGYDPNSPITL